MSSSVEYNMTHMAKANTRQQHTNYLSSFILHLKILWLFAPISSTQLPELYDIIYFVTTLLCEDVDRSLSLMALLYFEVQHWLFCS